jgi:hypothetical protein
VGLKFPFTFFLFNCSLLFVRSSEFAVRSSFPSFVLGPLAFRLSVFGFRLSAIGLLPIDPRIRLSVSWLSVSTDMLAFGFWLLAFGFWLSAFGRTLGFRKK